MSEEQKQTVEVLVEHANGLASDQLQRLSDIAYGMLLSREALSKGVSEQ